MIIDNIKILGSLFYQKYSKSKQIELVSALVDEKVLSQSTLDALNEQDEKRLELDFSRLFEGVGDMPVPPWGSVYLDKEKVLFGRSTIAYRQFLEQQQIVLNSGLREPEDQFGLMLLAIAYLLEENNKDAAIILLEEHFLIWARIYLKDLNEKSESSYYSQLAIDVNTWLFKLIESYSLNVDICMEDINA